MAVFHSLNFPALAPGKVLSVIVRLPHGPAPQGDLASEDRASARTIQHAPTRMMFEWGRKVLRMWLGQCLDLKPEAVPITVRDGRPFVPRDPVHFNISHSGDHLMIAMARHDPVGVDIEADAPVCDQLSMSRMVMSARETALLHRLSGQARHSAFLRLWVRREAYLKYRHTGFAGNDQMLSCLKPATGTARLDGQIRNHHWCITTGSATRIDPPVLLCLPK